MNLPKFCKKYPDLSGILLAATLGIITFCLVFPIAQKMETKKSYQPISKLHQN